MEYTVTPVEDQNLMFHIIADNNGEQVEFNVVCAQSVDEVPELVEHHLNFLNSPPVITEAPPQPDLTSVIQELKAELDALKAQVAGAQA